MKKIFIFGFILLLGLHSSIFAQIILIDEFDLNEIANMKCRDYLNADNLKWQWVYGTQTIIRSQIYLETYLNLSIKLPASQKENTNVYIDPITNDVSSFVTYQLFLNPYCKKHPDNTFKQAIDALIVDLKRIKKERDSENQTTAIRVAPPPTNAVSLNKKK